MKKYIPLILLAACSMGGHSMTMNDFYAVDIQMAETEVVALLGKPYAIFKKEDGVVEYEYLERIKIGSRNVETRHYFIAIKNGQVISKRVKQTIPLPYGFDSYDMQTTQNESAEE